PSAPSSATTICSTRPTSLSSTRASCAAPTIARRGRRPRTGRRKPRNESMDEVRRFADLFERIRRRAGAVVVGHERLLDEILIAFFGGGHVLIEGVPGIGKTLIVRTLAEVLNLSFNRIQFTIDLM